ncbi:hypothetical protein DF186_15510, partial [Enterococcus hirae]
YTNRNNIRLKLLVMIAGAASPVTGVAASGGFAEFESKLATFDPGGRYLTKPFERRVPGLSISGSYFLWADNLVSGKEDIGFRDRDFKSLQQ